MNDTTATETWSPIPGFEKVYEASDHGRIKSLSRIIVQESRTGELYEREIPERITSQHPDSRGYYRVHLSKGGHAVSRSVHRCVLEAFLGLAPDGMEACHEDDNPSNNLLSNLRWDYRVGNIADRKRNGGYNFPRHTVARRSASGIAGHQAVGVLLRDLVSRSSSPSAGEAVPPLYGPPRLPNASQRDQRHRGSHARR